MSTELWAATGAGAVGVLALAGCIVLWIAMRRLRAAQKVLLPDGTSSEQPVCHESTGTTNDASRDQVIHRA